jgi:hypothetical protein
MFGAKYDVTDQDSFLAHHSQLIIQKHPVTVTRTVEKASFNKVRSKQYGIQTDYEALTTMWYIGQRCVALDMMQALM